MFISCAGRQTETYQN